MQCAVVDHPLTEAAVQGNATDSPEFLLSSAVTDLYYVACSRSCFDYATLIFTF